jgi:glycosyltransferase involved in cell wall biosynthesis
MEMINISIITSLFRCEVFLEQFLNHFFKIKNLDECELILIHNDPSEEEIRIINKFNWQSIHIVHLQIEREGLYSSWNRAIKIAKGKYVAVWNVDDIRTPDSLLSQRIALDNSTAVLCYGDFYGTSKYGLHKDRLYQYDEFDYIKKDKLRRHVIGCFPMWRKDVHEKVGYFDEQFRLVSDFEFQLRLLPNYRFVKAPAVLGHYLEFVDHKLSSNRFLQDKERTVVEIRYKIYDKILMHTLPFIGKYKPYKFLNFGNWYKISEVAPRLNVVRMKDILNFLQMPFSFFLTFSRRSMSKLYRVLFQ